MHLTAFPDFMKDTPTWRIPPHCRNHPPVSEPEGAHHNAPTSPRRTANIPASYLTISPMTTKNSLPLDRSRRLRRHIINNPVYPRNLVDDPRRQTTEKRHVEGEKIGRHAIDRSRQFHTRRPGQPRPSAVATSASMMLPPSNSPARHRCEALRSDAPDQHLRHISGFEDLYSAFEKSAPSYRDSSRRGVDFAEAYNLLIVR